MFIAVCVRGVVLLLLASSSFARRLDDTAKTLDAVVGDSVRNSAQDRSLRGADDGPRQWNPAPDNALEHTRAAPVGYEQRIDEGVNATSDVKESRYGHGLPLSYGQCISQCFVQGINTTPAPTTAATITGPNAGICQVLATSAGITAGTTLQTYLQQCATLLGLVSSSVNSSPTKVATALKITAATTTTAVPTTTPPISGICVQLAANANITEPIALQAYLQQCAVLLGLIAGCLTNKDDEGMSFID